MTVQEFAVFDRYGALLHVGAVRSLGCHYPVVTKAVTQDQKREALGWLCSRDRPPPGFVRRWSDEAVVLLGEEE